MSSHYKPSYSIEFLKQASNKKFGIVSSEWNSEIIQRLLNGAYEFFSKIDINKESIQHYSVPGSFELISGCVKMQSEHDLDAIIAIGSIIQGETRHFDFISQAATNGIMELSISSKKPIGNGIITCLNMSQAKARKKKGAEAAEAVISVLSQK